MVILEMRYGEGGMKAGVGMGRENKNEQENRGVFVSEDKQRRSQFTRQGSGRALLGVCDS